MEIKSFEFNFFGEKTYVVYDPASREAAIIDPGMMNDSERIVLDRFIDDNRLRIKYIIATHIHVDHVMGLDHVVNKYDVGLSANESDAFLGSRIAEQVQMFHLPVSVGKVTIKHNIKSGDRFLLGNEQLEVLEVPGHSPGSIALYCPSGNFVITGDALFRMSIGRTDLPGGDHATLINSVIGNLLTLPESTVVYPGHGPSTTIGEERFNPFLR